MREGWTGREVGKPVIMGSRTDTGYSKPGRAGDRPSGAPDSFGSDHKLHESGASSSMVQANFCPINFRW